MNKQYFSTFITGFGKVVESTLKQTLENFKNNETFDGLVVYSTTSNEDNIKNIKFLNNTFLLIHRFENLSDEPFETMIKHVLDEINFDKSLDGIIHKKYRTFRIVSSKENQFISPDKHLISQLEKKISEITQLEPDRSYPDIEFWFLSRSEGFGFFGVRITRHPDFTKSLPKGELRPELAHILCLISEPGPDDIFFDPFAGYGSVPKARTYYPYERLLVSDNNSDLVNNLREDLKDKKNIQIAQLDTLNLDRLEDESINKIVTDPPWGHFSKKDVDIEKFYSQMLDSFYRVLKTGGTIVVLIGEKELFKQILKEKEDYFKLVEEFDTLVSGHKAGVYKIVKK